MDTPEYTTKRCNKCGDEYPATRRYFYVNRRGKCGLQACCKKCVSGREPKLFIPDGQKRCIKCGVIFPATAEYFYRNKCYKDGWLSKCKQCERERCKPYDGQRREYMHIYHMQNAKRLAEHKRIYYRQNAENMLNASVPGDSSTRKFAVFQAIVVAPASVLCRPLQYRTGNAV